MDKHLTERAVCEHLAVTVVFILCQELKGQSKAIIKKFARCTAVRTFVADNFSDHVLFSLFVWVANLLENF
jgi:hypothetical protein